MGSFGCDKKCVCISEESVFCASLSDEKIQNEKHNESYPKSKKHVKTIYDTQKEETECQCSRSQPQISLPKFDFDKELTDTCSDSDGTVKDCLRIFTGATESDACKGENAKQVGQLCFFHFSKFKGVSLLYRVSKDSRLSRIYII